MQEEFTVPCTHCLTLHWNIERSVTLRDYGGASVLIGNNIDRIKYKKYLPINVKTLTSEIMDGKKADICLDAIPNDSEQ